MYGHEFLKYKEHWHWKTSEETRNRAIAAFMADNSMDKYLFNLGKVLCIYKRYTGEYRVVLFNKLAIFYNPNNPHKKWHIAKVI